jgi:hypothetical protein
MQDSFSPAERAIFRRLSTPGKIQRFLDRELAYNKEAGDAKLAPALRSAAHSHMLTS